MNGKQFIDPDQMPQTVASNQGLHCLLRPICPILGINVEKVKVVNSCVT